jgi:hypothetical protein
MGQALRSDFDPAARDGGHPLATIAQSPTQDGALIGGLGSNNAPHH